MGEKHPPVDESRHPHRNDDARGFSGEQLLRHPAGRPIFERETRAQRLLEKSFEQRRHRPEPEGIDDHQMVGPCNGILSLFNGTRRGALLKVLPGSQERKIELRHFNPLHLMPAVFAALGIFIGQCVAEVPGLRIGMPLNDGDAFRHRRLG